MDATGNIRHCMPCSLFKPGLFQPLPTNSFDSTSIGHRRLSKCESKKWWYSTSSETAARHVRNSLDIPDNANVCTFTLFPTGQSLTNLAEPIERRCYLCHKCNRMLPTFESLDQHRKLYLDRGRCPPILRPKKKRFWPKPVLGGWRIQWTRDY